MFEEGREGWEKWGDEAGKGKVVVLVDESGRFAKESVVGRDGGRPHLVVYVQPLAGGLSRYVVVWY